MMPPPHIDDNNKTRVENIKKKFEDFNKFVPVGDNLKNVALNRSSRQEDDTNAKRDSRFQSGSKKQRLTADSSAATGPHLPNASPSKNNGGGHPILERQLSSPTSKAHVKRSPAFRCDRIVKGKNVVTPSASERQRSVVNKRVKQFDSTPDLVLSKHCNSVIGEEHVEHSRKSSSETVAERTRAFTAPSDSFTRVTKTTSSNGCFAQSNVKRDDVSVSELKGLVKRNIHLMSTQSSSGWTHNPCNVENPNPSGTVLNNSHWSRPSSLEKNILSNVNLKRVDNGFQLNNSNTSVKSDALEKNQINQISLTPRPFSSSVISSAKEEPTYQSGLSATLKAALKAPLPSGPPPKKPPRTFAHNSPTVKRSFDGLSDTNPSAISNLVKNCHTNAPSPVIMKPVRSKTESQIMLRKIEDAIVGHKTTQSVAQSITSPSDNTKRSEGFGPLGKTGSSASPFTVNASQSKLCTPAPATRSGCLTSLNCAIGPTLCSHPARESVCDTKSKSPEFVQDCNMRRKSSLQDNSSFLRKNAHGTLHKSHSVEHIYAEPFQFVGDGNQVCKSKDCEANFRVSSFGRDIPKHPRFLTRRILSTSPDQVFRARLASPTETKVEGLHYLCTPIQEDSPLSSRELHMSSLPLRLSPPPVEATNSELLKNTTRECLSLEMPWASSQHSSKLAVKRSPAEKDKVPKDTTDLNLNSTKIKFLMNQAFGSPLQCLPATPLDSNSDSDSLASSPDEGVSCSSFPGAPSPPSQSLPREIPRPNCPPPDVPGSASPSKESLQQLTAERRTYVRRVSSRVTGHRSLKLFRQSSSNSSSHLFECLLLVGLNLDPDRPKCKVPYIKTIFPLEASVPPLIENLCFPDAAEWPPSPIKAGNILPGEEQCYSLVITSDTGERKYGYCRRVQPEGAPICLPLAYCILTPFRASGFYYKVLAELESRHGEPEILQAEFIQQLYDCNLPSPGQDLRLSGPGHLVTIGCSGSSGTSSSNGSMSSGCGASGPVAIRRPIDTRLEERDITRLFSSIQIPILLQVFSSLLLERKVILLSKSISKLSACVDALQSILFPFVWQHTFIPVLPSNMLDICQAPTPYIIGVLKGRHPILPPVSIDDGIVVDVDNSLILQSKQDETTILPAGISRSLKVALQLVQRESSPDDPTRNVLVSEVFLRTFIEICGHYQTHIVVQQDGKKVFERESFIKAVRSHTIQSFLEWFTETAMFSAFIDSQLEQSDETKGMFEQRLMEHHEEREKNTILYLKNYRGINKKVKTLGDWLKDWAPFN